MFDKIEYRIWNKREQRYEGVYSRACHEETHFRSPEDARRSNCSDMYQDRDMYDIHQVRVTEKVLNHDS